MIGKLPRSRDTQVSPLTTTSTPPYSTRNSDSRRANSGLAGIEASPWPHAPSFSANGQSSSSSSSRSLGASGEGSTPHSNGSHPSSGSQQARGPTSSSDAYVLPPPRHSHDLVNEQKEEDLDAADKQSEWSIEAQSVSQSDQDEVERSLVQEGSLAGEEPGFSIVYPRQEEEGGEVLEESPQTPRQAEVTRLSIPPEGLTIAHVPADGPAHPGLHFVDAHEPTSPQALLSPFPPETPRSPAPAHRDSYFYPSGPLPSARSFRNLPSHHSATLVERASRPSLTEFPSRSKSQRGSNRWSDQSHFTSFSLGGRSKRQRDSFRTAAQRLETSRQSRRNRERDLALPSPDDEEAYNSSALQGRGPRVLMAAQRAIAPYRIVAPVLINTLFDFNLLFILVELALYPEDTSGSQHSPRAAWAIATAVHCVCSVAHLFLYATKLYGAYTAQTARGKARPSADEAYLSYFHRLVLICRSPSLHTMVKRVDEMATRQQRITETAWRWSQLWKLALLDVPRLVIAIIVVILFAPSNTSNTATTPIQTSRDPFFFTSMTGLLSAYGFGISLAYIVVLSVGILTVLWASLSVRYSHRRASTDLEDDDDDEKRLGTFGGISPSSASRPLWALDTQDRVRFVLLQNRDKHASMARFSQLDPLQSVMVTVTSPRQEQLQEQEVPREKGEDYDTEEDMALSSQNHHRGSSMRKTRVSWLQTTPPLMPIVFPERSHAVSPFEIPCSIGTELRVTNAATPDPSMRGKSMEQPESMREEGLEDEPTTEPQSKASPTPQEGADIPPNPEEEGVIEEGESTPDSTTSTSTTSSFFQRMTGEERRSSRVKGPRPISGKETFWENWFGSRVGKEEKGEVEEGAHSGPHGMTADEQSGSSPEQTAAGDASMLPPPPAPVASAEDASTPRLQREGSQKARPDSIADLLLAYQNLTSQLSTEGSERRAPSDTTASEEPQRLWPAPTVQPRPSPGPESPRTQALAQASALAPARPPRADRHAKVPSQESSDDSDEARIWASFPDPTPMSASDTPAPAPVPTSLRRAGRLNSSSGPRSRPNSLVLPVENSGLRVVNTSSDEDDAANTSMGLKIASPGLQGHGQQLPIIREESTSSRPSSIASTSV
ncbi:hypothetical protein BCV69DRAFT_278155 [Microstroma glucosiphilum]|uniref:Uncharacterized protein n=1 Tax=Pseudomicrostroma glucosiphilum TaxID=1684307 RepID=A0A316U2D0_9BASI|nr:hypothetical protein BCV69DRAFT_278155 [Pseudomicrostroma glucosiphilum]PWN19407.1 hypothetical protein BCV69DRAFT_278155 [Pseudomicrostroma glucosiphilum]